jgi:cell pole-organizing protein PopZ
MAQPAKGQEPSMEEILASIRRIIADDDGAKGPPKAAEPVQPPPPAPPPPPAKPVIMPPAAAMQEDEIVEAPPEPEAIAPEPELLPPLEPASDILDLTEQMAEPPPQADAGFRTIDGASDLVFEDAPPPPPPQPMPVEPPVAWSAPARDRGERTLISPATGAAVDSAFNTLAQTVLVQNGRTLEDLVREMLRPMLKTWLDDNLPGMVERLVRAEIERVSRGRP